MTYVPERDGIAACPDDPMRVSDAIEQPEEQLDALALQYEDSVYRVIKGQQPTAKIGPIEYGPFDLFECVFFNNEPETLRLLMNFHSGTRDKLILDWCYQQAEKEV